MTRGPFPPEMLLKKFFDELITENTLVRGDHVTEWRPLKEYRAQLEREAQEEPDQPAHDFRPVQEAPDLAGEVLSYGVHVILFFQGLAVGCLVGTVLYVLAGSLLGGLTIDESGAAFAMGGMFLPFEFGLAALIGLVVGFVFYHRGLRDLFHGVLAAATAFLAVVISKFFLFAISVARTADVDLFELLFGGDYGWMPDGTFQVLMFVGLVPGLMAALAANRLACWNTLN